MIGQAADFTQVEPASVIAHELLEQTHSLEVISPLEEVTPLVEQASTKLPKGAIRSSLRASTLDGVFAAIFTNIAGGVLLSNFLVELDATPMEIGMLSSIPMLANLLQPVGAYLANRTTSRHLYGLWVYAPARLLWLILVAGILFASWYHAEPHQLVTWTLGVVLITHFLGALGSASWLSWLAALVPRQLRGRYFGIRNSAASLTNLLCVPLVGLGVSLWPGGTLQGYGVILFLGVIAGLISLVFQCLMVDVNPQTHHDSDESTLPQQDLQKQNFVQSKPHVLTAILQDANFLMFLLYFSVWMFAVNVSAPFFNVYLLDNLSLDISSVTLYNSLTAGANLLMLVIWGKLADRLGNRPILILVGILVAVTPLLWLGTGNDVASVWFWLPMLHILGGGTWAAIDLCSNNIQLDVAPARHHATYFAIAAAVAGLSGGLGTTVGGFLAQFADYGCLPGLFALSSVLRLVALLPLLFVNEGQGKSIRQVIGYFLPGKLQLVPIKVLHLEDGSQ